MQDNKSVILKVLLGVGLGLLFLLIVFKAFSPSYAVISGNIKYNGITPDDSSRGRVVLLQKLVNERDFATANSNVKLEDNAFWHWDKAEEGKTYQLKAFVEIDGKRIADSSIITVTAPSVDQVLVFNITVSDLPLSLIEGSPSTISGELDLNGYVPNGSTVTVYGREQGETEFSVAASGLSAQDGLPLSWDAARRGTNYTFYAVLIGPDGLNIGESSKVTVAAPSTGQTLRIDSSAKPPDETVRISGSIRLSGPTDSNSTVLLLQRTPGETNFHAFDRVPAVNNATWVFDEAVSGKTYELTASLQVNEVNTTSGTVLRVTAPAKGEVITIDTRFSLNPPSQSPTAVCRDKSDNRWNVILSFPTVENASQYWVEAGTSPGQRDLLSQRVAATATAIQRNILINEGVSTFVRYAYSLNSACREEQCFSSFSPTLVFRCPQ